MTDPSSRHAGLPTYRHDVAGVDAELYTPRLRTDTPAERSHAVAGGDRLDLLAYRYLEDPHQFWRIADANPETGLDELTEPGRSIGIPGSRR